MDSQECAHTSSADVTVRQCSNMSIQRGDEVVSSHMDVSLAWLVMLNGLHRHIETRSEEGKSWIRGICDNGTRPEGLYRRQVSLAYFRDCQHYQLMGYGRALQNM